MKPSPLNLTLYFGSRPYVRALELPPTLAQEFMDDRIAGPTRVVARPGRAGWALARAPTFKTKVREAPKDFRAYTKIQSFQLFAKALIDKSMKGW